MNSVAVTLHRYLLLMLGLLWFVPPLVVRHTKPISTFYSEFVAFSLFATIFVVMQMVSLRGRYSRDTALSVSIPVGFVCALFLQLAVLKLTQPMLLFLALLYGLCAAMAIQVGYRLSQLMLADRVAVVIAWASVLVALVSVFIVFAQAFRIEGHLIGLAAIYEITHARRLFGNMFQPNHLASVLCMGMAGACYLKVENLIGAKFQLVILIGIGTAVAFTGSRMPLVQASVVAVIYYILLIRLRVSQKRANIWNAIEASLPMGSVMAGAVIVLLMNRYFDLQLDSVFGRIASGGQSVGRIDIWRYAWGMFAEHPLLGVGWGEFVVNQYYLADTLGPVESSGNAHNIFLDILAKTGIIGFLFVVVPLGMWCLRVFHAIRRSECFEQLLFYCMLLGIFAVHAMLEYPQTYAYFLFPACLLIGLCESNGRVLFTSAMSKTLGAVGGLFLAFGLIIIMRDYRRVESFFAINGPLAYASAPAFIFGDWGRYELAGLLELNHELLEQKIQLHEYSLGIATTPGNIRRYIILLALNGQPDSAMLQVKRLMALSPATKESEYRLLLAMCDDTDVRLSGFKARLIGSYGLPRQEVE